MGDHVRLEPLTLDHLDALAAVGLDDDLWRWIPTPVRSRDDLAAYVQTALDGQVRGDTLPFATVDRASGTVVGSTRLGNVDTANRRAEIGWTWVARPWQRTAVNTEAKLLLLRHAFGPLGCHRVEFKTDALNERSRRAILRLGAVEEGVFRKHLMTGTGRVRDSVWFSVTDDEWPAVEAGLLGRLASNPPAPLAVVRAWIDAANRQDGGGLVALSDPDIEIVGPRGAVRGAAVLRDWLERAGLTLETRRTFARGGAVVVEQRGVWRSTETGEVMGEADVASRFAVDRGRVTAFERFDTLDAALAAAGLSASDALPEPPHP